VIPDASCESMCVFLLLSGKVRYVPPGARVRVHQIWMGDRANDARAANYTAQDLMIVERDIGRLAKYTFDMGGSGDLLELALSIPPWEALHQLSQAELRQTNIVTTDAVPTCCHHGQTTLGRRSRREAASRSRIASQAVSQMRRQRCRLSRPRKQRRRRPRSAVPRRLVVRRRSNSAKILRQLSASLSCVALASIWPMASTTASKVSIVEA